ncbi:unnamed protein product [Haemonchus placei]|uniref:Retrovirus-related Pol polyprotein from transposon TNT 1-94 n=1 Tax=Haemonchus placei TaxID=6290 RepID=A0A0N4WU20_HAEPC|nr:unnamed protein product [Haemonchus placei]
MNILRRILCTVTIENQKIGYYRATLSSKWPSISAHISGVSGSPGQPSFLKNLGMTRDLIVYAGSDPRLDSLKKLSSVPYARMFTSPPFLAQLLCFYTTNLTMTFYHFYMPSFLKDVLYLGVIANGTFSSLPNVVNLVCKISWGILMDRLKSKKLITPTFAVRISQSVGDVQEWGHDDVKEKEKPVEKVDEIVLVKSRRTDSICVEYE